MKNERMRQLAVDDGVEITQLLSKYCLLLDCRRVDEWLELFEPDATIAVGDRTPLSTEQERRELIVNSPRGAHLSAVPIIRMGDSHERATSEQTFVFFNIGTAQVRAGWYTDDLVKREDRWYLQRRVIRFFEGD